MSQDVPPRNSSVVRYNHSRRTPIKQRHGGVVIRLLVALAAISILVILLVWLPSVRESIRGSSATTLHSADKNSETESAARNVTTPQNDQVSVHIEQPVNELSREDVTISWVKTLTILPESDYQLDAEHERSTSDACELLPPGEALELSNFVPYLTPRDYRDFADAVPALSVRRHIFSVGMDMLDSDKRRLPKLSSRMILNYMDENYITLQVRVQKEPVSGELFLHHRPIAAVATYRRRGLTKPPTEGLGETTKNYRSLGLYLEQDAKSTPRNLRTLVLLHKSEWGAGVGLSGGKTKFEFVFVRARDNRPSGTAANLDDFALHTFATSDERTKLHYLKTGSGPERPTACSVKNLLYFTEYTDGGLRPVASSSRGSMFNDNASFPMSELDKFAREQGWKGRGIDSLTSMLDAIIDGRIEASPQ